MEGRLRISYLKKPIESSPYYYGELDRATAEKILADVQNHYFILRYSEQQRQYVLSCKKDQFHYTHYLLNELPEIGKLFTHADFFLVPLFVERYQPTQFPLIPLDNQSLRLTLLCPFYYGNIDSAEADRLLQHAPNSSYLLRFSTRHEGFYATYKKEEGVFLEIRVNIPANIVSYELEKLCAVDESKKKLLVPFMDLSKNAAAKAGMKLATHVSLPVNQERPMAEPETQRAPSPGP